MTQPDHKETDEPLFPNWFLLIVVPVLVVLICILALAFYIILEPVSIPNWE